MIFEQSRYEDSTVTTAINKYGVYSLYMLPDRLVFAPEVYTNHLVKTGDRLDVLAARAYDDAELWWVIADANPQIPYPEDLKPGAIIKIPVRVT